jgi:ABC-type transporter Mla subunit MlaD
MTEPQHPDSTNQGSQSAATPAAFPHAIPQAILESGTVVAAGRLRTRLWWLTGLCVLLAIGLVVSSLRSQGKRITVRFLDGYGLKAGDTLRYRGIDVGSVTDVTLEADLQAVEVAIQLTPGKAQLATQGSQFWIQRARLRVGQITGLDTVLGAKYVGVVPGDPTAPAASHFVGQETPLGFTDGQSLEIRILFPAGEGLQEGDPVRYRGIAVGEVTYVELAANAEAVAVGVRLIGASRELARIGTQFWIERPRLDLTEVRGLETLVGGRYIAMQPTATDGPVNTDFSGLAEPPPLPRRDGSLEIQLDASRRLGLVRGAPVTYRGLEVGRVSQVGLASDGASVKIGMTIEPEYAELVRDNSKWWAMGGIQFDAGLSGVQISVESLSAWVRGGIAFATPPAPGERVVTGHRFMLEADPQPEWLQWQPRIAVRRPSNPLNAAELPSPQRVVASWQASWLGLYRRRTLETWGIPLSDGSLRVPASFVRRAQQAGSDITIEVAGHSFALAEASLGAPSADGAQLLATLPFPAEAPQVAIWSNDDIATAWSSESVLLVVNPELHEPIAIDGTRLVNTGPRSIGIAPGVAIAPALSGSPVIDAATGKLLGLLLLENGKWSIGVL